LAHRGQIPGSFSISRASNITGTGDPARKLIAPTLIVIGKVVRLRKNLDWFSANSR
jgi:siroheme synthase